ncbi:hypothetical protein AJ80_04447 [Polytolypa hystricis UAMH7299]|uniref:NADH-ubiquinone oxidoreductase 178 kDa subunit n=1 Tax=Polytolypa hystricis (strain UAMH7299) TaxID=1447883 RepID=A0A2B7YD01_POLH7|nr:hypothetical protein AJ80_04447 [Polytolypa hystricis UAMH7299]
MFAARGASAPVRSLLRHQPRRFASSGAHHAAPVNETFGRGFYIAVASVPVGLALYKYSTSDTTNKPWMTRLIEAYTYREEDWERTNALHTRAIEQAAQDRHLFQSQMNPITIELTCPEIFNTGSPINVPANNVWGNIDPVVAHYKQKHKTMEAERVSRMKDGKVVSIYEDDRYF